MRAGTLRHRIIIQKKTITRNSLGEEVAIWADYDTVWSNIRRQIATSRQTYVDPQFQSRVPYEIKIRYRTDLNVTEYRIKNGDVYISIDNILDEDNNKIALFLLGYEVQL